MLKQKMNERFGKVMLAFVGSFAEHFRGVTLG
jgi:hypothetical protein